MLRFVTILLLTISIFGCIDNSSDSSDIDSTQDPSGIWIGSQTSVGVGVFDMKTIIYDGRILGISEDAGVMYAGTYEMKEGLFMVSDGQNNSSTAYKLYDIYDNNRAFAIGMIGAHVAQKDRITGSYINDAGQEGEIDTLYTKLYERSVSLADVTGEWSSDTIDISIDEAGMITGTLDNCSIEGSISVAKQGRNMFETDITLSECDNAGSYSGLGIIMEDEDGSPYFMALTANEQRMEGFGFAMSSSPESFAYEITGKEGENLTSRISARTIDETYTGENHDGEDFTGQSLLYNIADASYRNAVFENASFRQAVKYDSYCYDPFLGIGSPCVKTAYYAPKITNSNFSGSSFIKTVFGHYDDDSNVRTRIADSDFSGTSFKGSGSYDRRLLISASGTDFSDSTFDNYAMTIDTTKNEYTGSTFINSAVTLSDGNLEGVVFNNSSLSVSKENTTLKDITFEGGTVYVDKNLIYDNVTINNGGLALKIPDFDTSLITINGGLSSLQLYQDYDISGWDLSGANITFYPWKAEVPYVIFHNGYASGTFKGTDFSDATISMPVTNIGGYTGATKPVYNPTYVFNSDFSKASFKNAVFSETSVFDINAGETVTGLASFYKCNFTATNFENADLSDAEFQLSKLYYANFEGADKPETKNMITSYYGNSWWFDGDRCTPISVGTCIKVPGVLNTGLSYEEYLDGKTDSDKEKENILNAAKDVVDTGKTYVEKGVSVIKKAFHF